MLKRITELIYNIFHQECDFCQKTQCNGCSCKESDNDELISALLHLNPSAKLIDWADSAIVGIVKSPNGEKFIALYNYEYLEEIDEEKTLELVEDINSYENDFMIISIYEPKRLDSENRKDDYLEWSME